MNTVIHFENLSTQIAGHSHSSAPAGNVTCSAAVQINEAEAVPVVSASAITHQPLEITDARHICCSSCIKNRAWTKHRRSYIQSVGLGNGPHHTDDVIQQSTRYELKKGKSSGFRSIRCACNSPDSNAANHQVIPAVVESEICVFILRTVEPCVI